ncbi:MULTISPECIES: HNH endonuclease signature motif containing protein [unclassified Gordonia (in: high G+C Gram-positive bacteria)]|uniref:HNH endonuclease n=1 Tax=unclassified Gordonia (in: high G+C Gram-positive bacteria) TaxID=2657482 RepID=UPI0010F79618|nr:MULTISPECIES: HNH endonuclease signature motif containing protein [unclassified Gordonia (in: high G+C Gram-positive bacteria)]
MPSITELRDTLISLPSPPDDGSGRAVVDRLDELRVLRNVLDHQIALHIALLEASGAAKRAGSTTRSWLIEMGMPPSTAHRGTRIGGALSSLPKVADCAADGYLAAECVDAVVRGMAFIDKRAAAPLSDDDRSAFESYLLAQAFSGASPAEINTHARGIAVRVADDADPDAVAAADDASLNTVHTRVTEEGRVAITADVTAVIGEKFLTMIDERSCPRPEPDGADDRRDAAQRRADGLELLLDQAAIGAAMTTAGAPRTQMLVTIPADGVDPARLQWVGAVSASTARQLSCDGGVAEIVLDAEGVPLRMGTTRRLFPHHLRQAIIVRDVYCVKCGAPAAHTQVHHLVPWADGGPTDLDNGCLLCQRCHTQVHHHGWEVVMGPDRHPWLIPPACIDPRRSPRPAYNRRTMRLDDALV